MNNAHTSAGSHHQQTKTKTSYALPIAIGIIIVLLVLLGIKYASPPGVGQERYRKDGGAAIEGPDEKSSMPQTIRNAAVTIEQAKAIALKRIPGTVTDVAVETKFGKQTYVVEIVPANGRPETDVIIDPTSGNVLGTEE